jgi:hypothetical protein
VDFERFFIMESIKYNVGNFFVDSTCNEKMRHDSLVLSKLSLWSENRKKTGRLFLAKLFFFYKFTSLLKIRLFSHNIVSIFCNMFEQVSIRFILDLLVYYKNPCLIQIKFQAGCERIFISARWGADSWENHFSGLVRFGFEAHSRHGQRRHGHPEFSSEN